MNNPTLLHFFRVGQSVCLFTLLAFFVSCEPEGKSPDATTEQFQAFGITNEDDAREALGVYADVFTLSDGNMLFRGTTYSNGNQVLSRINEFSVSHISPFTQQQANNGLYSLGEYALIFAAQESSGAYVRLSAPANDAANLDMESLFGTNVTFRRGQDKQNSDFEVGVSVPHKLEAELSGVEMTEVGLAQVAPDQSSVTWTADDTNDKGVVIYVHWAGETTGDIDFPAAATDVHRVMRASDNGSHQLDASLFEGIPSSAIAFLYVIRGDVVFANDLTGEHKCIALDQTQFAIVVER